jgi:hypothetical protein
MRPESPYPSGKQVLRWALALWQSSVHAFGDVEIEVRQGQTYLAVPQLQVDEVLQLVAGMQQRHHRAYLSHRKRRLHEIPIK